MPLSLARDDDRRRIVVTAIGSVTLEESLLVLERQADDGAWQYAMLYDGRGRDGVMDSSEIVRLVSRTAILSKRHGAAGPLAIVRSDPAGLGMGRMFEVFTGDDSRAVGVFRWIEDAERWLDELALGSAEKKPVAADGPLR